MPATTHTGLVLAFALTAVAGGQAQQPQPTQSQPRPMPSMHLPRRQFMNPAPAPARPAPAAQKPGAPMPAPAPSQAPVVQYPPGYQTHMGTPAVLPNSFNAPQGTPAVLPTGHTTPRGVTFALPNTGTTPQGVPALLASPYEAGSSERDVLLVQSGGFAAAGRIEGESFRLGFTVGSNPFYFDRFGQAHSIICSASICGQHLVHRPGFGWYSPYWYSYPYRGLVVGYESRVDPAYIDPFVGSGAPGVGGPGQPLPPAPPATAAERAALLLQSGLASEAIEAFKEHLGVHENDVKAIRAYALALLANRQIPQGVAMMALAYDRDAEALAADGLRADALAGGESALRTLVTSTVTHANDVRTGSAWLTVAVLMQGEGRLDAARRQLVKARECGLHRDIADAVEKGLKR
ncbi:MAG: hypothetical protein ACT4PL_10525 [Phycisphaerales bacterium]